MLNAYTFSQIEQLKRDAKRLAQESLLPHSNALDQVAASRGYANWSQLMKHSAPLQAGSATTQTPRLPFLFSRTAEAMCLAMRKATPNAGNGSTSARLRLEVADLSEQFISADNAIDFAIAYMESALSVPRYSVNGQSLAYYEMRCWLPYCIHVVDGDLRALVGRDYKPVGMVQKEDRMDYTAFPQVQLRMSEQQLSRLTTVHRRDTEAGYLYDASPWASRTDAQAYLKQLRELRDWMAADARAHKGNLAASASMRAHKTGGDVRPRHYVHGDQYEADAAKFYCAHCDAMIEGEHFEREHPGRGEERYFQSLEGWQRIAAQKDVRVRRPSDAVNALASAASAQRAAREQARSPFHLWITTQVWRDDTVGDLAQDIVSDREFPTSAASLAALNRHLTGKGAHPGAIDALKTAWREFESLN
jgi:hypothetical protein